jgi:PAS domain S-box-containing protein
MTQRQPTSGAIAPAPGLMPAPVPCSEDERATVLAAYGLDGLEDDPELASVASFAAKLCDAPIAVLSMVEGERQRFLARVGLDSRETPRSQSFCAHTMLEPAPMVVADATGDERFRENELVTGGLGIRFYAGVPLVSGEGVPLGALAVIDTRPRPEGLTAVQLEGLQVLAESVMCRMAAHRHQRAATTRASESARAMREIADMVPGIVWSADHEGKFDYFNSRWRHTTGADHPATMTEWGPHVHAEDTERTRDAWHASISQGKPFESEYRLKQADGTWRWTLARALPVVDGQGQVTRWYGTLTDIDEGHRRSENRDLLARELSHRIKNIFAVVASLVSLRARRRPEAGDFAQELVETIQALGRAHDFVRPMEGVKGDSLLGLLKELMAPYADAAGRVEIAGDDCVIGPRAATPLALTFHELATNSAKYGALSDGDGSVSITIDCGYDGQSAAVRWRERGGPHVQQPDEEGFGSRLLKSSIEGQLGGTLERRFTDGGLEVDLIIPRAAIQS